MVVLAAIFAAIFFNHFFHRCGNYDSYEKMLFPLFDENRFGDSYIENEHDGFCKKKYILLLKNPVEADTAKVETILPTDCVGIKPAALSRIERENISNDIIAGLNNPAGCLTQLISSAGFSKRQQVFIFGLLNKGDEDKLKKCIQETPTLKDIPFISEHAGRVVSADENQIK